MKEITPEKDLWGEPLDKEQGVWFQTFCTHDEVNRLLTPQTSSDYLLRLRAEYIADHVRLTRVFVHLRRYFGENWSLERFFSTNAYDEYKTLLSPNNYEKCKSVTCGSIYDNNAEGLIFSSEYGLFSTYSRTLYYFSIYATLALGLFSKDVPDHIRLNALRIACRIMLNSESEDFIVDPRGVIPQEIQIVLDNLWKYQSIFITGHELAHFILGHVKEDDREVKGLIKPHFKDDTDYRKINGYRISQLQEFEADLATLNLIELSDNDYTPIYYGALNWFALLAIYEAVEDSINPPFGYQTHPSAISRYTKILNNARKPKNFDEKQYVETLPEAISFWRERMVEDVSLSIEKYEMYGSVYLDAPNTEWRGRELIDRVDY